MNPESYDQIVVDVDTMGDQKAYLQEGMTCILSMYEGVALALQLPRHVTLEITETEPVVKGQTASSSYKPAMLSNRSEEHTSELQSLMRISYAVFCLKKKTTITAGLLQLR